MLSVAEWGVSCYWYLGALPYFFQHAIAHGQRIEEKSRMVASRTCDPIYILFFVSVY